MHFSIDQNKTWCGFEVFKLNILVLLRMRFMQSMEITGVLQTAKKIFLNVGSRSDVEVPV